MEGGKGGVEGDIYNAHIYFTALESAGIVTHFYRYINSTVNPAHASGSSACPDSLPSLLICIEHVWLEGGMEKGRNGSARWG